MTSHRTKKFSEINRDEVRQAVAEYAYFLTDTEEPSAADSTVYDAKRKAFHDRIGKALGYDVDYEYGDWKHHSRNWLSESIKTWDKGNSCVNSLEECIDLCTDQLIDGVTSDLDIASVIKTNHAFKYKIDKWIEFEEKKANKRMKAVEEVMDETHREWSAWYDGEYKDRDDRKCKDYGYDMNHHDYNGYLSSIESRWETIKAFAKLPKEAYTASAVKTYYNDNIAAIKSYISSCEAIAFRAERLYRTKPYYKYIETHKEKNTND